MKDGIYDLVKEYFSKKVNTHGATALGVDWNGQEAQELRFKQLSKILPRESSYTVLDYGCGYGAYLAYLRNRKIDCSYIGYDCVSEMIDKANEIFENEPGAEFICAKELEVEFDYAVASGVFNQRGEIDYEEWTQYTLNSLDKLNDKCKKGFAINFLTSYSDADKMRKDLYYADPCFYFDYFKRNYSRNVALLHDYGAYEFTLLVRKDS